MLNPGKMVKRSLIVASEFGQLKCVKLILEHRADLHARSANNTPNPFPAASNFSNVEIVSLLLNNRADVNAEVSFRCSNALVRASGSGHIDTVSPLIERGAIVNPLKYTSIEGSSNSSLVYALVASHLKGVLSTLLVSTQAKEFLSPCCWREGQTWWPNNPSNSSPRGALFWKPGSCWITS